MSVLTILESNTYLLIVLNGLFTGLGVVLGEYCFIRYVKPKLYNIEQKIKRRIRTRDKQ